MVKEKENSSGSCTELVTTHLYCGRPVHLCEHGSGDDSIINVDLGDITLHFSKWEFVDLVMLLQSLSRIMDTDTFSEKEIDKEKKRLAERNAAVEKSLSEDEDNFDEPNERNTSGNETLN